MPVEREKEFEREMDWERDACVERERENLESNKENWKLCHTLPPAPAPASNCQRLIYGNRENSKKIYICQIYFSLAPLTLPLSK